MSQHKDYLGDGVYADFEEGMIRLTAEDGVSVLGPVYLEPAVLEALNRYAKRVGVVLHVFIANDDCAGKCAECGNDILHRFHKRAP